MDLAVVSGGVWRTGERCVEEEVVFLVWPGEKTGRGSSSMWDLGGHRSERAVTVAVARDASLPATVEHSDLAVQSLQPECVCVHAC